MLKNHINMGNNAGWLVVVNPNAGGRRGQKKWPAIEKKLLDEGFQYQACFTKGPLHATKLTLQGLEEGFRKIIAVGGDGTLNEVANGILAQKEIPATDISLGMIPVGSGNDWARMFNIPPCYQEDILIIKQEHTCLQDTCRITFNVNGSVVSRFFVNLAGIGFEAEVVRRTNRQKAKGNSSPLIYAWYMLTALFRYKATQINLRTETLQRSGKYFTTSIGIGKYKGGGMITLPHAIVNDGLLDITMIREIGKADMIWSLPLLFNGKIDRHKKVETYRAIAVEVDSFPAVGLEADGEAFGSTPVRFEIFPSSLRIITGEDQG